MLYWPMSCHNYDAEAANGATVTYSHLVSESVPRCIACGTNRLLLADAKRIYNS
jgi:hypothetical protein